MKTKVRALQFLLHFFVLSISVGLFTKQPAAQTSVDVNHKFTSAQLIEDIDFYVKNLEETHIDPYIHISRKDWLARVADLKSRVAKQGAMTQYEFWRIFTPLVSSIQDKHTFIIDPRFFIPNDPTKYLPVRAVYVDGKILVTDSFADAEIAKGAVITSINGIESEEFIRKLSEYRFGVERERISDAGDWLWIGAAEVFGKPDTFALSFSDGKKVQVKGLSMPEISRREKAAAAKGSLPKATELPLELKLLEGSTAYLNATTFSYDSEKYRALLTDVFTKIKSSGAKRLIIDLRNNTGGNSTLGDALIDMFNAKPYKGFSMKWKKSAQYLERLKSLNATVPDYYQKLKAGEIYSSQSKKIQPSKNPLRFSGPVYVLSGRKTFSSGQMFLAVVKDNKLATMIGEETNEPGCRAGELHRFDLPNSKLRVSSSVKYWIPPGGCNGRRGIVPDVLVNERPEDYSASRDAVLSATLDLIRRNQI